MFLIRPTCKLRFARLLRLQPQRAIGMLALFVGLVLSALVANDLLRDYEQHFSVATANTSGLAQLLEEHARQSMRRVELSMSLAAQDVLVQTRAGKRISASTGTRLRALLPQDGLIASFAVLDARGVVVASTQTEDLASRQLAINRDFFQAQQDPAFTGLYIGAAVKSRISDLWIIPVGIKLGEGLDGYLLSTVDPEYFQRLYQSIDVGNNGSVTLYSSQGWAIARWPFNSEIAEHNWLDTPLFKTHIAAAPIGSTREVDAIDATSRVSSYRVLSDYPLVVALDEVLTPWRQRALWAGMGLLLTLLFLAFATAWLMAQLRGRQKAESALKLSEISVLKSSLPTLWIGPDGRVLRVNQAACDLHGYSEEQMLGMTVPDLNPEMPSSSWPSHWERLRQNGRMHFETAHRNRQGREIPVELDLNFIEFEGREYNFAFIRDLTLRKQAEAEIQRGAATLRDAIDAVDDAFVLFDKEDRLVYNNAKYLELYPNIRDMMTPGVTFESLVRTGAARGLYRESIGREEEWISERLHAHREGNERRIQKRDDGRVIRVIDRKTPQGNIVGIRVDITELVRATEAAQEASRYKSQFLANMSHEIRTPMNAILGLLKLLQKTELSPSQQDYASKTEGAAQSLLGLLNDILDFSKVEAGKMELDPQAFRLDRLLGDVSVILCSTIGGKNIDVLFDIDAAISVGLVGDSMRLQQVLVNLGGNAIKFTELGQVVLRVRNVPPPENAFPDRAWIEFTIEDSGIGIAPDMQDHIFSGFSQAEASTTRRFGGSGLGLAICKRLIELMGGQLRLKSKPGEGSQFSFTLPLPTAPLLADDSVEATRLAHSVQRVLIVDDNPYARDILSAMTRSWSWPTETASSGMQALALIRAHVSSDAFPFDVIYLDWQMPEMDGWETARQIRALCQGEQHPRIVMLTANGRDTLLVRTQQDQAMVDGFLFKPVLARALQDAATGRLLSEGIVQHARSSGTRLLAGIRILVVEDNLINQQVAEELLSAEGALVSLAANGQLGVDAVAASQPPFDVVLMDIQMPVLDGYGATCKIREQLGLTQLPIVAMTANALASDRVACLAAGMNEHVGKPFDMRQLVALLLQITGREMSNTDERLQAGHEPQGGSGTSAGHILVTKKLATLTGPYLNVTVALERLSGMSDLYLDIAGEYLKSLESVEGEFRQAAVPAQWSALVSQMHSLKGVSATLGAQALSEHAARLEKLFRDPPAELVALEQLPGLLVLVSATHTAIQSAIQILAPDVIEESLPDCLPSGPTERAVARAFLKELQSTLATGNLAVLERFASRGHVLDALPKSRLDELQAALQSLHLDYARQLCESSIQSLEVD
jgi:PAS domain S-box-containing protein